LKNPTFDPTPTFDLVFHPKRRGGGVESRRVVSDDGVDNCGWMMTYWRVRRWRTGTVFGRLDGSGRGHHENRSISNGTCHEKSETTLGLHKPPSTSWVDPVRSTQGRSSHRYRIARTSRGNRPLTVGDRSLRPSSFDPSWHTWLAPKCTDRTSPSTITVPNVQPVRYWSNRSVT